MWGRGNPSDDIFARPHGTAAAKRTRNHHRTTTEPHRTTTEPPTEPPVKSTEPPIFTNKKRIRNILFLLVKIGGSVDLTGGSVGSSVVVLCGSVVVLWWFRVLFAATVPCGLTKISSEFRWWNMQRGATINRTTEVETEPQQNHNRTTNRTTGVQTEPQHIL